MCLDYRQSPSFNENLLWLLKLIVESDPNIVPKIASSYYECLSSLTLHTTLAKEHRSLLLSLIIAPLAGHLDLENGGKCFSLFSCASREIVFFVILSVNYSNSFR
jgi:hypothetical protein